MKHLLWVIYLGLGVFPTLAQERMVHSQKYEFGIFGHYYIGYVQSPSSALQNELQKTFGNNYSLGSSGYGTGGGGMILFSNGVLLGGNGGTHPLAYSYADSAQIRTKHDFAYFNLGYCVFNQSSWILYPYVGFGAGTASVSVRNDAKTGWTADFDKAKPFQYGEKRTYKARSPAFELGMGSKFVTSRYGGVVFGLDAGAYLLPDAGDWKDGSRTISGLRTSNFSGFYLRLTIGGGAFKED